MQSLPYGLATLIGAEGMGISAGQRQRLLIARAVYKDPPFLFFDEATNALDANNEQAITDHIENLFAGRTVVVAAHRLSTVLHADKIIVIENGSIIGGTASQPALSVAVSGQNFLLSWPTNNSEGFVLQETQLQQNSWSNSPAAVVVQGNEKVASIPVQSTIKFYRLRKLLRQ